MEADIFVPFVFFGFLGAVILVPILAKERTKRSAHDLLARAMERGQPLDPSLISRLSDEMLHSGDSARRSLGSGVILMALAAGIMGAAYVSSGETHDALAPAIVIGALGAAFLLLAVVDYVGKSRRA